MASSPPTTCKVPLVVLHVNYLTLFYHPARVDFYWLSETRTGTRAKARTLVMARLTISGTILSTWGGCAISVEAIRTDFSHPPFHSLLNKLTMSSCHSVIVALPSQPYHMDIITAGFIRRVSVGGMELQSFWSALVPTEISGIQL